MKFLYFLFFYLYVFLKKNNNKKTRTRHISADSGVLFLLFLFCCQFCDMKSLYIWLKCFNLFAAILFSVSCFISHIQGEKREKNKKNKPGQHRASTLKNRPSAKPQTEHYVDWEAGQCSESPCRCRKTGRSEEKVWLLFFFMSEVQRGRYHNLVHAAECNAI